MLDKGFVDSILYANKVSRRISKSIADSLVEFYFGLIHKRIKFFEPKVEFDGCGLTIKLVALDYVSCSDVTEILTKTLSNDKEKIMLTKLNTDKRRIAYKLVTDILADNGYTCFIDRIGIPECTYFSIELR